jgi:hypothetical protein
MNANTLVAQQAVSDPDYKDGWVIHDHRGPKRPPLPRRHGIFAFYNAHEPQGMQDGPPQYPPINIEISGEDFDILANMARNVKRQIQNVPGLVDLKGWKVGRTNPAN